MPEQTEQPPYEAEATYTLAVARPVTVGPFKYLPRHAIEAKGELINRIIEEHGADAIRSADLLE
jgi:hypothetical protein